MVDYLTENALIAILLKYVDKNGIFNKAFKPWKFRPDFVSHKHKIVVEFDGYQHYTVAKSVINDQIKDASIISVGYSVVRIPYFVQFTETIAKELFPNFEFDRSAYNLYPHGFIDSKVILPADFCSLGVYRFKKDMERFYYIADEIEQSLTAKIEILGNKQLVWY